MNSGQCENIASSGYICKCTHSFTGLNCMELIPTTTTTTTARPTTTTFSTTTKTTTTPTVTTATPVAPTIRFNWNAWSPATPDKPKEDPFSSNNNMWNRWNYPTESFMPAETKTTHLTTPLFNWNTYNPNTYRTETHTMTTPTTTKFVWNAYNPDAHNVESTIKPINSWPLWTRDEKPVETTPLSEWSAFSSSSGKNNEAATKPENKWALWTRPTLMEIKTESPTTASSSTKFAWYTYNPNTFRSETPSNNNNMWPQWTRPTEKKPDMPINTFNPAQPEINWPSWSRPNEIRTEPTTKKMSWNTFVPDYNNGQNNNPWTRPNTEQLWNGWTSPSTAQVFTTPSSMPIITSSKKDFTGACTNFNDQICNHYASLQLCRDSHFINGLPITAQCVKACGLC